MGGRRGRSDWERGWERRDSVWRRQLWSYRGERRPGFYCCSCSSYCCWIRNHLVTIWWLISGNFEATWKPLCDQGLNTWRPLRVIFDELGSLDFNVSLGNSPFLGFSEATIMSLFGFPHIGGSTEIGLSDLAPRKLKDVKDSKLECGTSLKFTNNCLGDWEHK